MREDWDRVITKVHYGSPAEKAGLKKDDRIVSVDGDEDGEIPGPVDTPVIVVVKRNSEYITFVLERVSSEEIRKGKDEYYRNLGEDDVSKK